LRVGKFIEHFKAAAIASDRKDMDPVLKFFAISRQLGYAGYLTLDTICVLDSTGIKKWEGAKALQKQAATFWLMGLASSIISGVYTLNGLRLRRLAVDRKEGEGVVESKKIEKYVHHIQPTNLRNITYTDIKTRSWNNARLQLISDSADILLPSTSLGYLNLDDGAVGLAGVTSSLIGLYKSWEGVRQ
jgi:peroxin-11B